MKKYVNCLQEDNPPHVYAIGDSAYRQMLLKSKNQSMIISGESGAGKTEATKHILQYFASLGHDASETAIHHKILSSNPLLEAFGNAKTLRNDNSSRFGKFIEVLFNEKGYIQGALIEEYLLEKIRVVQQNLQERNYHIFYQLLCNKDISSSVFLSGSANSFHYTKQGGSIKVDSIDDAGDFDYTLKAMEDLGITGDEQKKIWSILGAILHLGNINFYSVTGGEGGSVVDDMSDTSSLNKCAKCLGLKPDNLAKQLVTRLVTSGKGSMYDVPLDPVQAQESRDALSMEIYALMFEWIVEKINASLKAADTGKVQNFIGILDIFGFEVFNTNRFEQLCINYANEKLQQYFQYHVLHIEQEIYSIEGVSFKGIVFENNKPCVDLIDGKDGILLMLDEEGKIPKGSDEGLLSKLHKRYEKHTHYTKPKLDKDTFILKHFAGPVTYFVPGKN